MFEKFWGKNEVEWHVKAEIRLVEFLVVCEACEGVFRRTLGLTERTGYFLILGRGHLDFCDSATHCGQKSEED